MKPFAVTFGTGSFSYRLQSYQDFPQPHYLSYLGSEVKHHIVPVCSYSCPPDAVDATDAATITPNDWRECGPMIEKNEAMGAVVVEKMRRGGDTLWKGDLAAALPAISTHRARSRIILYGDPTPTNTRNWQGSFGSFPAQAPHEFLLNLEKKIVFWRGSLWAVRAKTEHD